jgi:HlyD family secretion protein
MRSSRTPDTKAQRADIKTSMRRHLGLSLLVGAGLIVGIGGWATVTSLAGAVVAPGHFVVDSYVKKVQHSTGGIVGTIKVREGQRVQAGDVLLQLDATSTRANLAIINRRLTEFRARMARLEAERDDLEAVVFPAILADRSQEPDVAGIMQAEARLFAIRQDAMRSKEAQLLERIAQYEHEIVGLKAQEAAYSEGLQVLASEVTSLSTLRTQGAVSDQRLNSLKTQAATFGGERGEKIALQAQAAGRITETRLQILQISQDFKAEVGRELREIQAQIGEYAERQIAAEAELKRIDIVAPQSGTVHQLAVHTVGGVISPAEPILLIVPESDSLSLEVRIQPKDIDQIQPGQTAVLRMSAFNQRTTPELNATVLRVAPDLTVEAQTGLSYYVVRLVLPPEEIAKLGALVLLPGMPAEAFIRTGDRTALSYILKPLSDQINRAFRED